MWKLPDGSIINRPKKVVINDQTYASSIFTSWNMTQLSGIGIQPFREVSYDDHHYRSTGYSDVDVAGEIVRTHTITERTTLSGLKSEKIAKIKTEARSILNNTDWYVIRESETSTVVPADVTTYRSSVRSMSEDIESTVNGFDEYADLANYNWTWPIASGTF